MRTLLVLVFLALLPAGGWMAYRQFVAPKIKPQMLTTARSGVFGDGGISDTAKPDPIRQAYRDAVDEASSGSLFHAAEQLRALVRNPAAAHVHDAAYALLGEVNLSLLFSPTESPEKNEVIVQTGDTLNRISARSGVPAGLIFRANNLPDFTIRVGAKLYLPALTPSIEIRFQSATLTVLNNGAYLVRYPIVDRNMPKGTPLPVRTVVREKIAIKDEKRVAFGEPGYIDAYRWLPLAQEGFHILSQPVAGSKPTGLPETGFQLAPADMDELFLVVSNTCPVTILDE